MTGYIFTTEQEAIDSRTLCNAHYNIPIPGGETLNWCDYQFSELDNFYYIVYDESLREVLGEPIEFTVTQPELN
jgi:hypothetical protein